jgi:hypothetical protein
VGLPQNRPFLRVSYDQGLSCVFIYMSALELNSGLTDFLTRIVVAYGSLCFCRCAGIERLLDAVCYDLLLTAV